VFDVIITHVAKISLLDNRDFKMLLRFRRFLCLFYVMLPVLALSFIPLKNSKIINDWKLLPHHLESGYPQQFLERFVVVPV